jgi:hypothetical protein
MVRPILEETEETEATVKRERNGGAEVSRGRYFFGLLRFGSVTLFLCVLPFPL